MRRRAAVLVTCAALAGLQACATAGDPAPAPALVPIAAPAQGLVSMAELRALTRAKPWECINYDETSRTCEAIGRTVWRDSHNGARRMTFLLSGTPRVMAVMSALTWAEGDLGCAHVAEASVEVTADVALPEGAADKIEAAIRGSLAGEGGITCAGVVRDAKHFRVVSYRGGKRSGEGGAMRLFAEPPALRTRDHRV